MFDRVLNTLLSLLVYVNNNKMSDDVELNSRYYCSAFTVFTLLERKETYRDVFGTSQTSKIDEIVFAISNRKTKLVNYY